MNFSLEGCPGPGSPPPLKTSGQTRALCKFVLHPAHLSQQTLPSPKVLPPALLSRRPLFPCTLPHRPVPQHRTTSRPVDLHPSIPSSPPPPWVKANRCDSSTPPVYHTRHPSHRHSSPAMAQQQTPTFKLVLVGDGGTGKVCQDALNAVRVAPPNGPVLLTRVLVSDHLCQAPLDG